MCACRMFVNCFPNITITNAPLLSCLAVSEELFRHTINAAVCWSQVSHVQRLPWFRLSGCQYRSLFCPTKRYMVVGAFFFFTSPTPLLSHRVNLLTCFVLYMQVWSPHHVLNISPLCFEHLWYQEQVDLRPWNPEWFYSYCQRLQSNVFDANSIACRVIYGI